MKIWMAPSGLHIEPARTGDENAMARLHEEGFFRGWSAEEFQSFLRTPNMPTYVACNAKRKIAAFSMLRITLDECELMTIVVGRKFRSRGVAKSLMQAMFDDLRSSPVRRMFLEVDRDNEPARKLYEQFGFLGTGERQGYYARPDGKPATALVMRSELG